MTHSLIQEFIKATERILKRFPITVMWAMVVTGCAIYGNYSDQWESWLVTCIMVGGLGLSASLIGHIFSEVYSGGSKYKWVVWATIWIFLGLSFWLWYGVLEAHTFNICSAVLYCGQMVLLTLLVATTPYFKAGLLNQVLLTYNRHVFTSYVFTALLSTILYIALALAILVVNNLFNLDIDEKIYLYLMVFIAGIVWTGLFLNSFPKNYQDNNTSSYPAFRFIIQYIGIPVVIVYAIILIFYASANIFMQSQMEEWILWLILWFYVLGFLIFCLNFSIKDDHEATWSKWFYRWYLWGSIPISLLNIIGLWKAISDQGVTELTYIISTFSLFLLLTSIYLLRSDRKDFRKVLYFLFLLVFVSTIGPFNMCNSTVKSQLSRLEASFIDFGILENGQLKPVENVSVQNQRLMTGKLELLSNRASLFKLKNWDKQQLLGNPPYELNSICEVLGLTYVRSTPQQNLFIQGDLNKVIDLEDYEKIIPITPSSSDTRLDSDIRLEYDLKKPLINLVMDGDILEQFNLELYFNDNRIQDMNVWMLQSEKYDVKIHIQYAELNDDLIIVNLNGLALFKTNNHEN